MEKTRDLKSCQICSVVAEASSFIRKFYFTEKIREMYKKACDDEVSKILIVSKI